MERVSVVIPCRNAGEYVREAVESVRAQSYPEREIVIVDDGSTDGTTRRILEGLRDDTTIIIFQENHGPAHARNVGIRAASGTFILPLDADDRLAPSYIEKAVSLLAADPQLGIVYCRAERFGCETGEWLLPEFSEQAMAIDNVIFCSALFRKSDWEAVGGYPDYARAGMEDYAFWLRLLRKGLRVHRLDEILFYYRIRPVSRTTKFQANKEDIIKTYADIFRDNIDFFAKHAESIYRFRIYRDSQNNTIYINFISFLKSIYLYKSVRCLYRLFKKYTYGSIYSRKLK